MSTPSTPPVVLYYYEASPFAQKIARILTVKGIEHQRVEIARMPPRPELSDVLGIKYRRVPVLSIGRDVYCDTSLISTELERRFPESQGFATLFPARRGSSNSKDTGLIKAFVSSYTDRTLFSLAAMLLPWDQLPDAFIKDRSAFRGTPIDPKRVIAMQPTVASTVASHLNLVEEQLADGRQWLFDTTSPSLADIAMDFVLVWTQQYPVGNKLYEQQAFPRVAEWMKRMSDFLVNKRGEGSGSFTKISGEEAGKVITSASYDDIPPFDEKQGKLLGFTPGVTVSIAPEDTGTDSPTEGVLIGLTKEKSVIEISGSAGTVHVHFPRIGFVIRPANKL